MTNKNKEEVKTPAQLLSEIIASELKKDQLTVEIDKQRKELDAMMVASGETRISTLDGLFEALRYPSVGYEIDEEGLMIALSRYTDKAFLDKYMPRGAAAVEIRKLLDSTERKDKVIQRLRLAVRLCCTKHRGWKMKVQKAKKKSKREAVSV